jgi:hypothetical protein
MGYQRRPALVCPETANPGWASDPFSRNALDLGRLTASRTGQLRNRNLASKAGGFRSLV